jgi:hypothetical protein
VIHDGLISTFVLSLAVSGTNTFAGTGTGGAHLSTNNGTHWTPVNDGLTNSTVYALYVSGPHVFAGTAGGGAFHSTNNGTHWTQVNDGLTNTYVNAFIGNGTNTFAGTAGGVFLSTNNGILWTRVNNGLTDTSVYALARSGTNTFAGTRRGVFLSTNNGSNWTPAGLTNVAVKSLLVKGTNLFAGTSDRSVWVRPLSELITSMRQHNEHAVPEVSVLEQNYPNPFNPSTTIRYGLPSREYVKLTVFNTLGQSVSALVNSEQDAGYHEVRFNGASLPSGVYFYRMQAGSYTETRRLLVLK